MLGRELHTIRDGVLLRLERMRLIDQAHYWSASTHKQYQNHLRHLAQFDQLHDTNILSVSPLLAPPAGPEIPLQWFQECYSLRPASVRRLEYGTVSFETVKAIRSSLAYYQAWDMMVSNPGTAYFHERRIVIGNPRPTDCLGCTMHATGLAARIGSERKASFALLDRHVRGLDTYIRNLCMLETNPTRLHQHHLAGLANLLLWLGWFRSSECFSLRPQDFEVILPGDGLSKDLPADVGAITCRLLPQTKTNRAMCADVIMAYETISGYRLGEWFESVMAGIPEAHRDRNIFVTPDGKPWTSLHFRSTYAYPCFDDMQAAGDQTFAMFSDTIGDRLRDHIWALHSWRRGARDQSSRGGYIGYIKMAVASKTQREGHARWRTRQTLSAEDMDTKYSSAPMRDRIKITLLSQ